MRQTRLQSFLLHLLVLVLAAVCVLPFLWILATSFKTDDQIFTIPPKLVPLPMSAASYTAAREAGELTPFQERWGFGLTLQNYRRTFTELPFMRYLWNSTVIVVLTTVGTVLSCAVAAYAFACLDWPDRTFFFYAVIATMLLPYQVTLIPVFVMFRQLEWIDTILPLVVPTFFGPPFFIFLLRQFFLSIPKDMLEAARIDGASEAKILAQLVMPLSRPALMTVGIFAALGAWNDFLGPLIYLNREESKTLAVGLHSLTSQFSSEWGLLMAAGSLMIVPVLILFFFAQRYFIEGITLTGSKG